jgi:type II secretory pathway pseudopilin PulG
MIEMLGVLMIMGIITVGAITMISAAMRGQKRSGVQDEIAQITTGVRQLLGEYDDFSLIDNNTIFGAIGVSNKNPYGGLYEVSVDYNNPQQFIVSIHGLNKSDCEFFKTKAWTDSVGYQSSDGKFGGAEADPSDCNASSAGNTVHITFGE